MNFNDIRKELDSVVFESLREDAEGYFEAVVIREQLQVLSGRLTVSFGVPLWPSEKQLPQPVQKIIKEYGGIREGQTLWCSSNGGSTIVAMLWPWQDGFHTTLKMIRR